jgi:ferric-dicitrate binding protein FerR (iron transport regulator)
MNNSEIEVLISKHLSGEASPKENQAFRHWLNSNSQNKEDFNKIALSYQLSKGTTVDNQKSRVLSRIKQRIDSDSEKRIDKNQDTKHEGLKSWISIAASILVFLSVGALYFLNSENSEVQLIPVEQVVLKSNPAGQKSKVFLPDGSIVWLNSESSISYEGEFNDSTRHVHLTGEAYFEVKKDHDRPFVVYSGTISTTALGTAFNVNAFDEKKITVSLTQGKVNVESSDPSGIKQGLIILPGEGAVYNSEMDDAFSKIVIDPTKVMMWRDGLLFLENSTLTETITKLERWYGVKIIINNRPKDKWSANGLFDNEYLDNVLHSLSFSQAFDYEIKGKQVYMTFK